MRSDRDFLTFFKGMMRGKRLVLFVGVLLLAVLLIFYDGKETERDETTDEERLVTLISSVEGAGECRVTVVYRESQTQNDTREVFAVAVVCEGGDNVNVRARITELVTTLYGVGANRVSVMKLSTSKS